MDTHVCAARVSGGSGVRLRPSSDERVTSSKQNSREPFDDYGDLHKWWAESLWKLYVCEQRRSYLTPPNLPRVRSTFECFVFTSLRNRYLRPPFPLIRHFVEHFTRVSFEAIQTVSNERMSLINTCEDSSVFIRGALFEGASYEILFGTLQSHSLFQ